MSILLYSSWLCADNNCSIESMKMETVIRSPQQGVIAKLVHKEGVSVLLSDFGILF